MDVAYWDARYAENQTLYGLKPNPFFKSFIDTHKPGTILLPAEGEGRNAIYAASKGWEVDAFDFSKVAREKALFRAAKQGVHINYTIGRLENYSATKKYDAIALIYVHLPYLERRKFHEQVYRSLKSGGFLILEAFAKEQMERNSGGPKDVSLLYDASDICDDFQFLHILSCRERTAVLEEGPFHKGKAEILELIGQKL